MLRIAIEYVVRCLMDAIAQRREDVYNYFHANAACQAYFFDPAHEQEYVAYYNSMYLLQDSTESLWQHRERGFSADPLLAYLEFWGIMQAAIIQQDAIAEIYNVTVGQPLSARGLNLRAWLEVRELRNVCAGHPARKDKPKNSPIIRSFMGRMFGGYDELRYERWEQGVGTTHPTVRLGAVLDVYAVEAETQLSAVLSEMKAHWP
jgi:hypothetical protein